ncbi:ATP-binding protein [Sphingomonas alba]|uniref:histidine kinase n=1 Tax=Sphingomonas alba TaxID=2908208 RepID=A0ABT0RLC2_9SPHN|nr:ATP-binding protein [Sphingomonas alba]MCL6683438.1 ATP-binding protein [Sphingomonas alba]
MLLSIDLARSLIGVLDEPALIIEGARTAAANDAAKSLLGQRIEDSDLRFAIRHPEALRTILAGKVADVEVVGIGSADRPWLLSVRPIERGLTLARLIDQSAGRAAERMRVDFVANASHELRTPLATIAGYAETLADEGEVDEQTRRRFGSVIQCEARRMLRIVEDLMSLSRIEAERFLAPREAVDLGEVARLAADHAGPLIEKRSCTVELKIESGMPPVAGDFAQLLQTADNLVGNAIRYGCTQENAAVIIEVRRDGDRALFSVHDSGDGIAAEHLPRLTERFYRVDAARSRDSGGTGLGLAIVKHIVERHRGRLTIESQLGQGTTVQVALPFEAAAL